MNFVYYHQLQQAECKQVSHDLNEYETLCYRVIKSIKLIWKDIMFHHGE